MIRSKYNKYIFYFVNTAIFTLFLANGISHIVFGYLLLPSVQLNPNLSRFSLKTKSHSSYSTSFYRVRNPMLVCNRNIFDYRKRPCKERGDLLEEEDENRIIECNIKLKLLATVVSDDREWSFALVSSDGKNRLIRVDDEVEEGFKVKSINWRDIVLTKGNTDCIVDMWVKTTTQKINKRGRVVRTPSGKETIEIPPPVKSSEEIEVISETERIVSKEIVDKFLEDPTSMLSSVRIIPYEKEGVPKGVRLFGIRRNSLLWKLGLKNGDILHSIDDQPMTTPEEILKGYMSIKGKEHISINITRRGKPMTIDVSIRK